MSKFNIPSKGSGDCAPICEGSGFAVAMRDAAAWAIKASQPVEIDSGTPFKRAWVIDGAVHLFDVPEDGWRKRRRLSVDSYQSLVAAIGDAVRAARAVWSADVGQIWLSSTRITYFFDSQRWDETIELQLAPTAALVALQKLTAGVPQSELVTLLRTGLRGCFSGFDLLAWARGLKFRQSSESSAEIKTESSGYGRSVMAEVSGVAALPEELLCVVEAWDGVTKNAEPLRVALAPTVLFERQQVRFDVVGEGLAACLAAIRQGMSETLSLEIAEYLGDASGGETGQLLPACYAGHAIVDPYRPAWGGAARDLED